MKNNEFLAIFIFLAWMCVCFFIPKEMFNLIAAIVAGSSVGIFCGNLYFKE